MFRMHRNRFRPNPAMVAGGVCVSLLLVPWATFLLLPSSYMEKPFCSSPSLLSFFPATVTIRAKLILLLVLLFIKNFVFSLLTWKHISSVNLRLCALKDIAQIVKTWSWLSVLNGIGRDQTLRHFF